MDLAKRFDPHQTAATMNRKVPSPLCLYTPCVSEKSRFAMYLESHEPHDIAIEQSNDDFTHRTIQ